ncbi:MAG TPA: hypothetical protein DDW76_17870 [Cyanobacteria bacterium UBA11369]|nr:hypothetical protein [Cyanobacteria bacterium UBA11371]HBE50610.1 hypothetical protein [Cyanobacteria bacterium UBA11369]
MWGGCDGRPAHATSKINLLWGGRPARPSIAPIPEAKLTSCGVGVPPALLLLQASHEGRVDRYNSLTIKPFG